MLKSLSGGSDRATLLYSGLFYLCGVVGVLYSGYSSDRSGDRKWHCIAGQVLTGLLLAASTIPSQPYGLVMVWLFLTGLVVQSWPPPFWALPTITLTASAAAASIGFINIFANLAGYLGNHLFGFLRSRGMSDGTGLLFLAGCYLLGGAIVSRVRVQREGD
jgi:ACS family tartrate transporter-like MFS transporter